MTVLPYASRLQHPGYSGIVYKHQGAKGTDAFGEGKGESGEGSRVSRVRICRSSRLSSIGDSMQRLSSWLGLTDARRAAAAVGYCWRIMAISTGADFPKSAFVTEQDRPAARELDLVPSSSSLEVASQEKGAHLITFDPPTSRN